MHEDKQRRLEQLIRRGAAVEQLIRGAGLRELLMEVRDELWECGTIKDSQRSDPHYRGGTYVRALGLSHSFRIIYSKSYQGGDHGGESEWGATTFHEGTRNAYIGFAFRSLNTVLTIEITTSGIKLFQQYRGIQSYSNAIASWKLVTIKITHLYVHLPSTGSLKTGI